MSHKRILLRIIQKQTKNSEVVEHLEMLKKKFTDDLPHVYLILPYNKAIQDVILRKNGGDVWKTAMSGSTGLADEHNAFHKYFRIKWFIGETGEDGNLSYSSLLRPLE